MTAGRSVAWLGWGGEVEVQGGGGVCGWYVGGVWNRARAEPRFGRA